MSEAKTTTARTTRAAATPTNATMNTTTQFNVGDSVVADSSVQGLRAGNHYKVVAVHVQSLPFGDYVTYEVQNAGGPVIQVVNGHFVLSRLEGGAK